jgi:3D (Asp-Asp-Asp) domain-containing protein
MKKIIILLQIITLIFLLSIPEQANEDKYYIMNVTFYSLHKDCISDKWNDGKTATNTDIRKGVAAINVDMIDGEWKVVSPLKLGQRIYIEDLGEFVIEDTGRFAERDAIQDIWTIDVYEPNHQKAIKGGRKLKRVWVLEG